MTIAACRKYAEQCKEWSEIAHELTEKGLNPSAFDVSEEQRRRLYARDDRPVTYEEMIAPDVS